MAVVVEVDVVTAVDVVDHVDVNADKKSKVGCSEAVG